MNNSCIQQVIIHRTTVDPFDFQVKKDEVRGAFQLLDDSLLKKAKLTPQNTAQTGLELCCLDRAASLTSDSSISCCKLLMSFVH